MKLIYQKKEYTLSDLEKENNNFTKKLKNPNFLISNRFAINFAFDPEYNIASDFFYNLYNQITRARFALIMGHKKIHDRNYVDWKSGEKGQYWLRSQYLENSIIWYNSSFDILLQTIWFGFSLYRKINKLRINKIDSPETYNKLLLACKYPTVKRALVQIGTSDSNDLLRVIEVYSKSNDRKKINGWANKLKHDGNFVVREL